MDKRRRVGLLAGGGSDLGLSRGLESLLSRRTFHVEHYARPEYALHETLVPSLTRSGPPDDSQVLERVNPKGRSLLSQEQEGRLPYGTAGRPIAARLKIMFHVEHCASKSTRKLLTGHRPRSNVPRGTFRGFQAQSPASRTKTSELSMLDSASLNLPLPTTCLRRYIERTEPGLTRPHPPGGIVVRLVAMSFHPCFRLPHVSRC